MRYVSSNLRGISQQQNGNTTSFKPQDQLSTLRLSLNLIYQMSNWDQLYDLEPLLHTPPTNTSKQPSYFASKPSRQYDSDVSSVSSAESVDDFDSPVWWDVLDHEEEEANQRYKILLHENSHKKRGFKQQQKAKPEIIMTRVEAKSKPLSAAKTKSLPERCKEKSNHTHIVDVMQDSHDLAGPVEFCFWSMNGQPCQCGKC